MYHEFADLWKDLLKTGLKDDGWPWDWTTLGTRKNSGQILKAKVVAKSPGVWAAESLVHSLGISAKSLVADGTSYRVGDVLVELGGPADHLLALERPFLNLAAYVSGIATATARLVEIVKKACPENPPRITLTRKTLPGYRDVAILGVRAGGGFPHRVSLSGGILIKENHIAAAGGIEAAITGAKKVAPHGLKIEVEVRSLQELEEALRVQADGVLLDNFTPIEVQAALQKIPDSGLRPFVEVSGGIHEKTVSQYALPGVDIISVGSLTHSTSSVDLSLLVI